jgi:hypothetical protein
MPSPTLESLSSPLCISTLAGSATGMIEASLPVCLEPALVAACGASFGKSGIPCLKTSVNNLVIRAFADRTSVTLDNSKWRRCMGIEPTVPTFR